MITKDLAAQDEIKISGPKKNFNYETEHYLPKLVEKSFTEIASEVARFTTEKGTHASEIVITSDGILSEAWTKIENIPSMVVSSDEDYVILDCLTNFELKQYEKRQFETHLIKGKVSTEVGSLILIKIFYKPGEIKFTFSEGKDLVKKDYFLSKDADVIFESLKKSGQRLTKKIHF